MPPPRKSPPRRRERRTRSRSYSPRPSYSSRRRSPKNVRERRWSQSPQRTRSPPRRRSRSPHERPKSPRPVAKWSPPRRSSPRRSRSPARRPKSPARRSRSHSFERDQPVKRVPADSSGKRVSAYRSRSPSPVHIKRPRDEREYREEPSRSDSRRDESRRFSSPVRGQESGYSPRGRSPSPKLRESPYGGKMYADKPSSSRAPLFPVGKGRNEISSVTIVNKARLEKLDKRFQTLEQISRGSFDFEENITIGIHRGPSHVTLDEDVPVNYEFNPKTFLMLYSKKETHKAIFDRDEILQFHHDDILDEEAYVEKRTITVQPNEKAKPKWTDSVDYKVTVGGRASRDDQYAGTDRRMVRDSGRRRSSRDPEVTVRLDPKPDPRYEKLFKETQRRGRSRSGSREPVPTDPHDLRHNLNKRRDDYDDDHDRNRERGRLGDRERDRLRDGREVVDARRKIEARRSEQGVSLDRGMDLHITRTEQKERRRSQERFRKERGRASLDEELPDFKNRPEKFNFETWKVKPEITPKGASYYLHDERSRDDMNFWERKQYFLATGQSPRLGPPTRGRGSFRSRGAPRPYRGRGARGSTRGFTSKRGGGNEMEWKHDKFSEINKESEKESKKEVKKSDRKEKHKRKKSKENGKEKDDKKKKNIKDKEKDKSNKRNESEDTRKSKVNKGEIAETEGKKGKVKSEGTDRETAKGGSEAIDTGNVGPNFSNLLTLT